MMFHHEAACTCSKRPLCVNSFIVPGKREDARLGMQAFDIIDERNAGLIFL